VRGDFSHSCADLQKGDEKREEEEQGNPVTKGEDLSPFLQIAVGPAFSSTSYAKKERKAKKTGHLPRE